MVTAQGAPSLVRRQLGRRMRRMREGANKTMEDVIASGVASRSKLWRIEGGHGTVRQGDVLALARLYRADLNSIDDLLAMADATKETGFSEDFGGAVPQSIGLYVDLEAGASVIFDYSSELFHGLLQTADYARAVISADRSLPPDVAEQRVAFRIERQRRFFDRPGPGRLEMITTAGVMSLRVGSAAVMEAQLAHLRAMNEGEAVGISVLSASNGVHRAMQGPFILLDFDDEEDPSVAYVENLIGSRYIERPTDVAQFRQAWHDMRSQALPLEEWINERDNGVGQGKR